MAAAVLDSPSAQLGSRSLSRPQLWVARHWASPEVVAVVRVAGLAAMDSGCCLVEACRQQPPHSAAQL